MNLQRLLNIDIPALDNTPIYLRELTGHARLSELYRITLQLDSTVGNLDAYRDWGHAKDYVRAMWMMMQHDVPDDYVISTCESHTVREFLEEAFYAISYDGNWEDLVVIDPQFYRPAEVDYLNGVSIKARTALGWTPEYAFEDLVAEMVEEDL